MFFESLNGSLASRLVGEYDRVDLIALWPLGANIQYGETKQVIVGEGKETRLISVYRNESGRYENPVTYLTNI